MNWLTILWPMASAASLTLAVVYFLIWSRGRRRLAYVLFTVMAIASAANALIELQLMTATTISAYDGWLRVEVVAVATILFSMVGLVRVHFGTGRLWLMWTIIALWVPGLVRSVVGPSNGVFSEITALYQIPTYGGAVFTVVEGVRAPLAAVADLASLLIVIYVVDASVALARRGNRRRAWVVGGGITLFILVAGIEAPLVDLGLIQLPYIIGLAFIAIVVAMGYELGTEVVESGRLGQEVQARELRWQSVMENIQLLVMGFDLEGKVNYANPYALAITGYTGEELLGRSFKTLVPAEDQNNMQTLFPVQPDSVAPLLGAEIPFLTRQGDPRTVIWFSVEVPAVNSPTSSILIIGRDVTIQRETEKMTAELRMELTHANRVSSLGELTGAIAHELNQPLGAILSNAEAAELLFQTDQPPIDEIREILDDIRKDDLRASAVIQRMRALLGKHEFEVQSLRLETVIENVLNLLQSQLKRFNTTAEFRVVGPLPLISGDRIHLQQVLLNLVFNSMNAMHELPVEQRTIVIEAASVDEQWVQVGVADAGTGIDPAHLPRLFEAFFTTKEDGLGMGLSVCRTIIDAHGGIIEACNNPDRGATVLFTLPVAEGIE